jgi:hypothetical protein
MKISKHRQREEEVVVMALPKNPIHPYPVQGHEKT